MTHESVISSIPTSSRLGGLGRAGMFRYAVTIFVSAFLLFQVQPLIGRSILPWFGGGPSIWTSCMLFFQILLLGGYLYAHLISVKLKPRMQVIVHLSLLAMSLAFLPISPSVSWKPVSDQSALLQILFLLLATVGGPYFMLSSTGPLMQKWFNQSSPGQSPWRLYALSNIGSLLALLSYPFVFEPWLTLKQQVWSWSVVYGAYVALAMWCGLRYLQKQADVVTEITASSDNQHSSTAFGSPTHDTCATRPGIGRMLLWLGLAACSSAMLLATTNQLCIDVATVPFLWVLPLSLYLISFIICFDSPQWYDRRAYGLLLLACTPVACWVISEKSDVNISKQVAIYATVLFACCMTCHGELFSSKPHPRFLTTFYLLISAGGALGGVCVAIIAPYVFHGYWEYHIGLVACCVVTLIAWCSQRVWLRRPSPAFWIWASIVILNTALMVYSVYLPLKNVIDTKDETIVFGVFGLIQLIGLIFTGTIEHRGKRLVAAWSVLSALMCAWFIGYGAWQFSSGMSSTICIRVVAIAVASPLIAGTMLMLSRLLAKASVRFCSTGAIGIVAAGICSYVVIMESKLLLYSTIGNFLLVLLVIAVAMPFLAAGRLFRFGFSHEQSIRFYRLGAIYLIAVSICGILMRTGWIQDWQGISFASTTGAAVLMEWSADSFQRTKRASLGFWFWIPGVTLILLLSNRLAVIVESHYVMNDDTQTAYTSRNFYGVLRVELESSDNHDEDYIAPRYLLTHGQIKHGFQFTDEYWKTQPTTYYGRKSGVGIAIRMSRERQKESETRPLRVGVVGLGTGTIAAYGETGDYFRFYDINPDVVTLSDVFFTYLSDSAAKTEVVIGDARIMMEREIAAGQNQQFDVLVIDAFSSDAIPVHLLTSECGDIYRQHLKPGGILAIHISNRFLDLNPVSRGLAKNLGWSAFRIADKDDALSGVFSSTWILLTSDADLGLDAAFAESVTPWKDDEKILHWTDDYSGLWQVLSL